MERSTDPSNVNPGAEGRAPYDKPQRDRKIDPLKKSGELPAFTPCALCGGELAKGDEALRAHLAADHQAVR